MLGKYTVPGTAVSHLFFLSSGIGCLLPTVRAITPMALASRPPDRELFITIVQRVGISLKTVINSFLSLYI